MDQIKQLIDQYGPQVWNNIAAPVWEAAVRQAVSDGIVSAINAAVTFVFAAALILWAGPSLRGASARIKASEGHKCGGYSNSCENHEWITGFGWVATFCGIFVLIFFTAFFATQAVQHFYNPQWYAIQNLLGAIKK